MPGCTEVTVTIGSQAMGTPAEGLASGYSLPDLGLLLLSPLAVAGLGRKKNWQHWTWPVAGALLVIAVASSGATLAEGAEAQGSRGVEVRVPALSEHDLLLAPVPAVQPQPAPRAQSAGTITTTRVISYTYDPLNRLTGADYSTGERFEYSYDAVGNRTAMTATHESRTTQYEYDVANRLTSVDGVTYTWDARGNLLSDGTFTYTYNSAGRLARAQSVTSTLVYTYNAAGLRVAQSVDSSQSVFSWDWASGIPEMLSEGDNLYLVGHETLGAWDGSEWAYHLPDALGSVRQVADGAGAVVSAREWSPYGVEVGAGQAGLGYTGEWWDSYAQIQYTRARWYQPRIGRWTSPDPIIPDFSRPQSINKFAYVLGNPVLLTDPLGLCAYDANYSECVALAGLLARAYTVGSPPSAFLQKKLEFIQMPYEELQALWARLDPVHSQKRYDIIEQEATRFGLPPEFIAAVIAAEVEYDTDWINTVYDVWTTCLDWQQPDFLPPNPFARLHMELWHYYYGAGPLYLNPEHGFGEGPAPGIGNIHAGVAADVEQYFATTYPDEDLLPLAPSNARRLELLRRYEWNVRYVAGYLRQLADVRTGQKGPHLDLTDNDMEMIFVAYHADLAYCFGDDNPTWNFQRATCSLEPACQRFADQLDPFLALYRRK